MRMTGTREGVDEALSFLRDFYKMETVKQRQAIEYILRELRDYARLHAPFTDRTGNLRNSIDFELDPEPALSGTLFAGQMYGIFVERLEGYWVLQGAIDFYEPKLDRLFAGRLKIERPDLEREAKRATLYYRRLRDA